MSTLRERIEQAIAYAGGNKRAISTAAGFKSPTHLSALLQKNKPEPNPTYDTLCKLAEATKVSLCWLVDGSGAGPGETLPLPTLEPILAAPPHSVSPPPPPASLVAKKSSLIVDAHLEEVEQPSSSGTYKTFKDLPNWEESEKRARKRWRRVPDFAWRGARELNAANAPAFIDETVVLGFAQAWLTAATPSQLQDAEEAEVREVMAKEDADYAQRFLPLSKPVAPKVKKTPGRQKAPKKSKIKE